MGKLILVHKADSIYEDEPDAVYDFPRSYLKAVEEAVGDWVICYDQLKLVRMCPGCPTLRIF